jgi:hypothetical protein
MNILESLPPEVVRLAFIHRSAWKRSSPKFAGGQEA